MPIKKELAGSAKNGVAKNQYDGSGDRDDYANGVIAELIEHIEAGLAAVDFAVAPMERVDSAPTELLEACRIAVPIVRCHASMSYVCGHQALSINLFWTGASQAASQDADIAVERQQPEAVKIQLFSPGM